MVDEERCLAVAVEVALEAGKVILDALHREKHVTMKGVADPVTETDVAVERLVFGRLREAFPTHGFVGEETASNETLCAGPSGTPTWICDPIDGTSNFSHGHPNVCVSIALAVNGRVVLGVIHAPALKETYTARRGAGAFLNGEPIHVSKTTSLKDAVIETNVGYRRDKEGIDFYADNVMRLLRAQVLSMRSSGSAALDMAYSAAGRICAYFEWGVHVWDVAAGSVIVEEAGGVVLSPDGTNLDLTTRRVLCGNRAICEQLSRTLRQKDV